MDTLWDAGEEHFWTAQDIWNCTGHMEDENQRWGEGVNEVTWEGTSMRK